MAVPKKKTTKSKRNQRRAHWKVSLPEISRCSSCGAYVRPYHVCTACGHYRGKQVLTIEESTSGK